MQAAGPELLDENDRSLELWNLVFDQVRLGPKGFYVLDIGACATVFEKLDRIDDVEFELVKMKHIFAILNPREDKKKPGKKEKEPNMDLE